VKGLKALHNDKKNVGKAKPFSHASQQNNIKDMNMTRAWQNMTFICMQAKKN
jgi:hypothetical protein